MAERPTGEPTAEELALAQAYADMQIGASNTWTVGMRRLMDEALRDICHIVWRHTGGRVSPLTFRFGAYPKMEAEITLRLMDLSEALSLLLESGLEALTEDVDEDVVLPRLREDLSEMAADLSEESESRMAAYFFFDLNEEAMSERLTHFAKNPWRDILWTGAVMSIGGNAAARILRDGGTSEGTGRSNVVFNRVRLYGETQMDEVMEREMLQSVDNPQWFCSLIADSTACDTCKEEEAKGWQPISNYSGLWHPYCRCRFVFR